ncbi:hypothetical protein [Streptomyces sp. RFCAC02]|uniref:hypothetical protein n=1 Tax=Streptomyces sp. RFCAC02 TaxID=2499143 RepID=UPI001020BC5F|nr:hypothetical protein [Streptomyces sp. RFCAC02]
MTGLQELEQYGYLERYQERDERGRLGSAVYRITDSPRAPLPTEADEKQEPRSEPMSENPTTDDPTSDDPRPKKNKSKKTNPQKTSPSPPSVPVAPSAGVSLLLAIGAREPRLRIGGQALSREGQRLDDLLAAGWDADSLRAALTGGLPLNVTHPAGFLARRIGHIPPTPSRLPLQDAGPERSATYTPPRFGKHVRPPALPECDDCGRPPVPGRALCAECLGWPLCSGCQRRRGDPEGANLCRTCGDDAREQQAAEMALRAALRTS